MTKGVNQYIDVKFSITDEDNNQLENLQWCLECYDAADAFAHLEEYSKQQSSKTNHTYECSTFDEDGKLLTEFWFKGESFDVGSWVVNPFAAEFRLLTIECSKMIREYMEIQKKERKCKEVILVWERLCEFLNTLQDEVINEEVA